MGGAEPPDGSADASESDATPGDADAAGAADEEGTGESAAAASLSGTEDSDAGGIGGGKREGRARALLSAPGVDAASGVRGWRRRNGAGSATGDGSDGGAGAGAGGAHKVSIVQDVLSVLFGWEVSSAADKKAAIGGAEPGARSGGGEAGVMFA